MLSCLSLALRLFCVCFVFVFFAFIHRSTFPVDYACASAATPCWLTVVCALFCFSFFFFLGRCRFLWVFRIITVFSSLFVLYGDCIVRFPLPDGISLLCVRPGSHTHLANSCLYPLLFFCFLFLRGCHFFRVFRVNPVFSSLFVLYGDYVERFPLPDGDFLPCDYGLDF